jgi:hypothetical protein
VSAAKNVVFRKEYRIQQWGNNVCFVAVNVGTLVTSRTECVVAGKTVGLIVSSLPHLFSYTLLMMLSGEWQGET